MWKFEELLTVEKCGGYVCSFQGTNKTLEIHQVNSTTGKLTKCLGHHHSFPQVPAARLPKKSFFGLFYVHWAHPKIMKQLTFVYVCIYIYIFVPETFAAFLVPKKKIRHLFLQFRKVHQLQPLWCVFVALARCCWIQGEVWGVRGVSKK